MSLVLMVARTKVAAAEAVAVAAIMIVVGNPPGVAIDDKVS